MPPRRDGVNQQPGPLRRCGGSGGTAEGATMCEIDKLTEDPVLRSVLKLLDKHLECIGSLRDMINSQRRSIDALRLVVEVQGDTIDRLCERVDLLESWNGGADVR